MMKNLCVFIVFFCVVLSAAGGRADTSAGDLSGGQNHHFTFVDNGPSGPYLEETVTIDLFWNKVAMFKFDAEKEAGAILRITRLTPDTTISWGFVGIDKDLYRLDDFLSGPDTVFVRDVQLGKNNHVFVHVFGDPGASLLVQVLPPLPTIMNFSVTPTSVTAGQGAVLTWSTLQAETVTIEPGIGHTTPEGTLTVTPESTTLYTLTAANSYGSAGATARLEVLSAPVVSIAADPEAIAGGGSARLSWTSTDADTCYIEPDVGAVNTTGSVVVSPSATTTYTITATGPGGTAADSVTVQVDCPLDISITSPVDGAGVSGLAVPVTGTVTHTGHKETGVTVNGVLAIINGNQFRADHVFLTDGENLITATATDALGNTTSAAVTVQADTSANYILLTADPVSGIPPFETTLRINGSFDFTASDLSYDGPGTVTFLESSYDEYRIEMDTEGVYTFTATVTNEQGYVYTSVVTVAVINQAGLEALLQEKWGGMKAALLAGNAGKAVEYFADSSRESYSRRFTEMASALPQIVGDMGNIRFVSLEENRAVYDMRTVINGTTYSFQALFVLDTDGIWRIRSF